MGDSSPKEIVRRGWNEVSTIYRADTCTTDAFGHDIEDHNKWLKPLLARLKTGSKVLDLGCGCGVPDAQLLSRRFEVVGVDISEVQIARARRLVPQATFFHSDMTRIRFLNASFDGAICFYSIIHVPLAEQPDLIDRVGRWIRPGGPFVMIAGATPWTGTEANWLGSGSEMYLEPRWWRLVRAMARACGLRDSATGDHSGGRNWTRTTRVPETEGLSAGSLVSAILGGWSRLVHRADQAGIVQYQLNARPRFFGGSTRPSAWKETDTFDRWPRALGLSRLISA